ncbi:hypothetical protein BJ944DRAFT_233929 [Cunninghamella echinulata]|nr:hypothetical protein BJ944DRAFT_233929 [Cunninghamella echinulata]
MKSRSENKSFPLLEVTVSEKKKYNQKKNFQPFTFTLFSTRKKELTIIRNMLNITITIFSIIFPKKVFYFFIKKKKQSIKIKECPPTSAKKQKEPVSPSQKKLNPSISSIYVQEKKAKQRVVGSLLYFYWYLFRNHLHFNFFFVLHLSYSKVLDIVLFFLSF